ncbi:MAG: RNA recognition motif [bacterium ADurb.Bin400]|nr:MAG: RNA recognition motif [bacterium ADurb.Bin400]
MQENNKLYVGNLPYTIDDDALANLFAGIEGVEVAEAKVIIDKFSGRSKGFGFVTVANDEMAQVAITAMNGKEVEGREIVVNIAKPMTNRDDRRPSGGGRQNYGRTYR